MGFKSTQNKSGLCSHAEDLPEGSPAAWAVSLGVAATATTIPTMRREKRGGRLLLEGVEWGGVRKRAAERNGEIVKQGREQRCLERGNHQEVVREERKR